MSMMFDETLRGIWYLSGRRQDWLASVNEDADGKITAQYRFRYYTAGPEPDAPDKKNWYDLEPPAGVPLETVLDTFDQMQSLLVSMDYMPSDGYRCALIRGGRTFEQFAEEFMKLPFVHKTKVPDTKAT